MSAATQTVVMRRLAVLTAAITAGELQVNSETDRSGIDGNYDRSIVSRSNLLAYAKAQGHRPEFLFSRQRPTITLDEVAKLFGVSRMQLIEGSPLLQKAIETAEDAALKRELAEAEAAHEALVDDQATAPYPWLVAEIETRRKRREPHDRDTMTAVMRAEYPELSKTKVHALYAQVPKELRRARIGRPLGKSGRIKSLDGASAAPSKVSVRTFQHFEETLISSASGRLESSSALANFFQHSVSACPRWSAETNDSSHYRRRRLPHRWPPAGTAGRVRHGPAVLS